MKIEDIVTMLDELEIPVAYYMFPEGKAPNLPWCIYYMPGSENFNADSTTFQRVETLNIELYTKDKDFDLEDKLIELLNTNEMPYTRTETYIESEKMYEVSFTTQVVITN